MELYETLPAQLRVGKISNSKGYFKVRDSREDWKREVQRGVLGNRYGDRCKGSGQDPKASYGFGN